MSIGTVDTHFGAGTGASKINLGYIKATGEWRDISSSFIATQDGSALLTWQTAPDAELKLARIDLGNEAGVGAAPPAPTPTPDPTVDGGSGNGGGGGLALLDFAILPLVPARLR